MHKCFKVRLNSVLNLKGTEKKPRTFDPLLRKPPLQAKRKFDNSAVWLNLFARFLSICNFHQIKLQLRLLIIFIIFLQSDVIEAELFLLNEDGHHDCLNDYHHEIHDCAGHHGHHDIHLYLLVLAFHLFQ